MIDGYIATNILMLQCTVGNSSNEPGSGSLPLLPENSRLPLSFETSIILHSEGWRSFRTAQEHEWKLVFFGSV
jgi:hypothetical protein